MKSIIAIVIEYNSGFAWDFDNIQEAKNFFKEKKSNCTNDEQWLMFIDKDNK